MIASDSTAVHEAEMPIAGKRWWLGGFMLGAAIGVARPASAFLLVTRAEKNAPAPAKKAGAEAPAPPRRMTVVVLREGDDIVLSVQAELAGAPGDVALLVPVPASAAPPKAMPAGSLDALARVAGPRLAEYWEQDPCAMHDLAATTDGTLATPKAPGAPPGGPGAYAIEVLPAKTGAEVVAGLAHDGYRVPPGVDRLLDDPLKAGARIAVARIAANAMPREGGWATLPPLEIHVTADRVVLPTRLFAAGGRGDLSVFVLAGSRYEAADQPNLAVPTNLDVTDAARASFPSFYGALVDRAFASHPGAVLTEYAWRAASCELCASPLAAKDLAAAGVALLPSAAEGKQHEVMVEAAGVASRPDGPDAVRAKLSACYARALATAPGLAGTVTLNVEVDRDGAIASTTPSGAPDTVLAACANEAVRSGPQWKPGARGTVAVSFAPLSRAFLSSHVLTALSARFDAVPPHDLVLTPARAIEGGREMSPEGGAALKRVYPAMGATDDFQARYVVRHPWAGPIACASPERGVWGGPPKDAPGAAGSTDAGAPRAPGLPASSTSLDAFLKEPLPDLSAFAIHFGGPLPPPAPAEGANAPAAADVPPAAPTPRRGCGACAAGAESTGGGWFALLAVAALAVRARRSAADPRSGSRSR